jgi:MORN repeat variant
VIKVERSYHEDGSLRSEVTLVDGLPHGVTRHWHPKGVLASEIPITHGVVDGIVKQWNQKGELLGSYEMKKGTGVIRQWYENGQLQGEISMIDNDLTGRQLGFTEDGELIVELYRIRGKEVSRKRYMAACQKNPALPQYEELKVPRVRWPKPKKSAKGASPGMVVDDAIPLGLLKESNAREALSWLEESCEPSRSLGEATSQEDSIRLVKKLYELGAVRVHAVKIDGRPEEDQNSGKIVVELPQDSKQRKRLLKVAGKLGEKLGFEAEPDMGQRYTLIMLD